MSWVRTWVAATAALVVASAVHAVPLAPNAKLPDAVAGTFRAKYPTAEIEKIDVTEENGVNVYDIEFSVGKAEHETDIAEDGTMLEFTDVITANRIPAAPLKAIRAAARGARLGRLERIEMSYETKDGQVVKLPATVLKYAAEMSRKGGQTAEIIVNADGSVSEAPNWVTAK